MFHVNTQMCVEDSQVTDAINCLLKMDIVSSVWYEERTHKNIGPFKSWFISIKPELEENNDVCNMVSFIHTKGYHTIYNDDIYWRVSIV